jgi:hypothetical protein
MRLVLKLAVAVGALWAVWAFVPLGGRTLDDRWRAAPTARAFAGRGWRELAARFDRSATARPGPRTPPDRGARDPRPTEGHTEADRKAVDRIVSRSLRE